MTSLPLLEDLLLRRTGIDASTLAPGAMAHAVRRRLLARGADPDSGEQAAAYAAEAARGGPEWGELVEELVVPETWFFRDGAPWEAVARWLRASAPPPPLRLLSMPCATGEEAYSLAIVLEEAGLRPDEARVDAVDLSRRALAAAARGVFPPSSFRGAEGASRRDRFRETDRGLAIDPAVKARVTFVEASALEYEGTAPPPGYHVVCCRNLLIYLGSEARSRLVARIDSLLAPGGLLVLGHAESLSRFFPSYRPAGGPRAFAAVKEVRAVRDAPERPVPAHREARPHAPHAAHRPHPHGPTRPGKAAPAAGDPGSLLAAARAHADRGELSAAAALCDQALGLAPSSAEAHLLRGVVARAGHDDRLAEAELRKALYLAPAHHEARAHLGLLLEASGRRAEAERLLRPQGGPRERRGVA